MDLTEMFEDDAPPQIRSGISVDEAIQEFIKWQKRLKESAIERDQYKSFLIERAAAQKNGQQTVHMEASTGSRVKVEFKTADVCDQSELECAREILGEEFTKYFRPKWSPIAAKLKTFMNTTFADERKTTAQEIIRAAIQKVPRLPEVTIEKD